jgi:hypothetical protein
VGRAVAGRTAEGVVDAIASRTPLKLLITFLARHVERHATQSGAVGNGEYYIAVVTALTAEIAIRTRPVPA